MIKNNKAVILIVVLCILAVLSLMSFGLSKRSAVDMSLMRNNMGRLKAYAAARAGINFIQEQLLKNPSEKDTLYQMGIKIEENQKLEDLLKNVKVDKDTHFDILFDARAYGLNPREATVYGLEDEGSRINLNAIDQNNSKIFSTLLESFKVDRSDAEELAKSIVHWRDQSEESSKDVPSEMGQESSQGHTEIDLEQWPKAKGRPFDSVEELLLVKGMTTELYLKIKDFVTVYPKNPDKGLRVNFMTASDQVIRAFILGQSSIGLNNDEDLARAIITQRNGLDNKPFTSDDGAGANSSISALDQMHINALVSLWGYDSSEYYRVHAVGVDDSSGSQSGITAVINRSTTNKSVKIVYWHRD